MKQPRGLSPTGLLYLVPPVPSDIASSSIGRMTIRYSDGTTDVRLGDRAALSIWFRRRVGRVVYVPGVSPFNPEFEYNGMRWVGIRLEDRSLVATPVLLATESLKPKVQFLERDASPNDEITETSREFERDGE